MPREKDPEIIEFLKQNPLVLQGWSMQGHDKNPENLEDVSEIQIVAFSNGDQNEGPGIVLSLLGRTQSDITGPDVIFLGSTSVSLPLAKMRRLVEDLNDAIDTCAKAAPKKGRAMKPNAT